MNKFSKLTLLVTTLSGIQAYAGTMGPTCQKSIVETPCEERGFAIGGQALYLKPTSNIYEIPYSIYANGAVQYGVENAWAWGFQLEADYRFETGNDFNLNWYRLHTSYSQEHAPATVNWVYNTGTAVELNNASTRASVNPEWDQVNIEFGQRFNYGDNKHFRFHAGAQYSRVANNSMWDVIDRITIQAAPTITSRVLMNTSSSFNGFGPRVGVDAYYQTPWYLGVYAKAAMSMLAGTTKFNYVGEEVVGMNGSLSHVIPGLDAKLGLNYDYQLPQGVLTADIGWLWVNYINVLTYSFSAQNSPGTPSSFEVQGLYFGLKYTA